MNDQSIIKSQIRLREATLTEIAEVTSKLSLQNEEPQNLLSVKDVSGNSGANSERIDSKYFCPITNRLMKYPVIAFDGKCYEKEAIVDYIGKYKQSPITKEKISDVEWTISLLYTNQSLKEEIDEKFLNS